MKPEEYLRRFDEAMRELGVTVKNTPSKTESKDGVRGYAEGSVLDGEATPIAL